MLKYLDGGPILNFIFLAIAIVGVLIGIYYGRKAKRLVFNWRSTTLVRSYENIVPHLTVLYRDSPVQNLTLAKIAVWNFGNDVINNVDIPPLDKIRLTLNKPFRFLEANINYASKSANNFSINISPEKDEIMINFDFIEKNDGLTLALFHTGNTTDLTVNGAVKGAGKVEDFSFMAQYNVGALVGKLMLLKIGGEKGTFGGALIRILFFPIVFLLILPGDMFLSLGNGKLKYRLIKREFFLD